MFVKYSGIMVLKKKKRYYFTTRRVIIYIISLVRKEEKGNKRFAHKSAFHHEFMVQIHKTRVVSGLVCTMNIPNVSFLDTLYECQDHEALEHVCVASKHISKLARTLKPLHGYDST